MVKKIDKLTPEQEAQMPEYSKRWAEWGLSTEDANRPLVEEGIKKCYEIAGHKWHGNVFWSSSPYVTVSAGVISSWLIGGGVDKHRELMRGYVGDETHNLITDAVRAVLGSDTEIVYNAKDQDLLSYIRSNWWNYIGGRFWSSWIAWKAFFRDVCDLELDCWDKLDAYTEANSAGIWWPHEDFTIVTENPLRVLYEEIEDEDTSRPIYRLHSTEGPALSFRDGMDWYYIHGVKVPERYFLKELTAEDVLKEENQEVRRVLMQKIGIEGLHKELNPKLIHKDECGTLWNFGLVSSNDQENTVMVEVLDPSTNRLYLLQVPPDMERARQAVAFTYGIPEQEYVPKIRT